MTRHCYQCQKEIADIQGKYFCSRECWELYGKDYKPLKGSKLSIKELQERILKLGEKVRIRQADTTNLVAQAEIIFETQAK